uniref:Uncharacterized protein n=1 Tax=Arundo donax TaxID=35708 RepID=A0A0A9HGC3_ARUDO
MGQKCTSILQHMIQLFTALCYTASFKKDRQNIVRANEKTIY